MPFPQDLHGIEGPRDQFVEIARRAQLVLKERNGHLIGVTHLFIQSLQVLFDFAKAQQLMGIPFVEQLSA
ncbi:hypothetical protein D3C81_1730420 [compost metagenome]